MEDGTFLVRMRSSLGGRPGGVTADRRKQRVRRPCLAATLVLRPVRNFEATRGEGIRCTGSHPGLIEPCYFCTGEDPQPWRYLAMIVGREASEFNSFRARAGVVSYETIGFGTKSRTLH